ncbi:unnamed protein product, partial [Closterium sp. NIES-54]
AFRAHEHTDAHKAAVDRQLKIARGIREGQQVILNFINSDVEGRRAVRLLRLVVFLCKCDAPISMYPRLMRHLAEQDTPDILRQSYGVYLTRYGFQQMVHCLSTYLTNAQMDHINSSPFLGLQCNESTDRTRGKHMIVYLTFIKDRRVVTEFFTLLTVEKCDAASLFEVLMNHLRSATVDVSKLVGISTDGALVMTGKDNGLVARIREHAPHLFSCHCIAHRDPHGSLALTWRCGAAAVQGARCVYRSSLGAESQGVRDRHIDVTEIAKTIEATTADLTERYLDTDKQFGGEGKCWLVGFLKLHGHGGGKKVRVRGVDGEGRPVNHLYTMHERKLPGHKVGSGYEECVKLCRSFARDCMDNLNERLDDLGKLGPTKLFRAGKWPKIKAQREKKCREWLMGCSKLFRHKLSGFDLKAAERELPTFCAIMEAHHELESFTQGLTNILGSADSKRSIGEGWNTGPSKASTYDDLGKLGPTKLFRAGKWPKIKAQREKKCREWLMGCSKLFRHKLPGFDLKAAERELPTFCAIMEAHHELESFTQGLTNILGSADSKRYVPVV